MISRASLFLWIEFLAFYGGVPLVVLYFKDRSLMLGILWVAVILICAWLRFNQKRTLREEWNWQGVKNGIKPILLRFAMIGPGIFIFLACTHPEALFSFPTERPLRWAMVMLWYPLLSVVPQELVYKTLFFGRYGRLFSSSHVTIVASALAFGYMHIILLGWIPVVATTAAGFLFAMTYVESKSLALVSIEHALYGCWAYTVGMGVYLYTGAAWGIH